MATKQLPGVVSCRTPIRDGYTKKAVFRENNPDMPYSGVAILFRPALQSEVVEFLDDPRPLDERANELILKHVTAWNVSNDDKTGVAELKKETVAELVYPVLNWMVDSIVCYAISEEVTDEKN